MHPRDLCKALQALDVWAPARVWHHLDVTFFAIRLRRSVDHLSGLQYNLASFVTINIIKDVRVQPDGQRALTLAASSKS